MCVSVPEGVCLSTSGGSFRLSGNSGTRGSPVGCGRKGVCVYTFRTLIKPPLWPYLGSENYSGQGQSKRKSTNKRKLWEIKHACIWTENWKDGLEGLAVLSLQRNVESWVRGSWGAGEGKWRGQTSSEDTLQYNLKKRYNAMYYFHNIKKNTKNNVWGEKEIYNYGMTVRPG